MHKLKVGFHYHTPAIQIDGVIRVPSYIGLFIDSIAPNCAELVCFLHSPPRQNIDQLNYPIRAANVKLVSLKPHSSIPKRTVQALSGRRMFREWEPTLDVMLVRASTPLLPVVASAWSKPLVLLLVSDATAGLDNLPQPGWRKVLIKGWARWYQKKQDEIAKRCLTIVNSRALFEYYANKVEHLVETRTTTLSDEDFFEREDTCNYGTCHLLYAGRISRIKGLFSIVEALAVLVDEGFDLRLDLVGMVDPSEPVLGELEVVARDLGVANRLKFHGYKAAGQELLAYYRRADIFVTASEASSEGFPRTIWEAMASSVPVVATEVGSISAFAGSAISLVPPKRVDELTNALREVLTNSQLRGRLIRRGMKLAKGNTLEIRAEELVSHIEQWYHSGSSLELQSK